MLASAPWTWRPGAFAPEERNVYSTAEPLERTSPLGSGRGHFREARKGFHAVTSFKYLVPYGTKAQHVCLPLLALSNLRLLQNLRHGLHSCCIGRTLRRRR